MTSAHSITTAGGHGIAVTCREPSTHPKPIAVVQVLHGLRDHLGRYERLAAACQEGGFAFIGHDHRGHGVNSESEVAGHFADRHGWDKVVEDGIAVQSFARRAWPESPLILFGHSMGAAIAQSVTARAPQHIAALALSGPAWAPRGQVRAGRRLARLYGFAFGARRPSPLLDKLGLEAFNRRFAPARTEADWLSRDEAEVDKYLADPYCNIPLSNRLWYDLLGGLLEVSSTRTLRRIPTVLPVLITGGAEDPVGGRSGLTRLAQAYAATGHENVTLEIWPGGRHEMLNEIGREAFTAYLLAWFAAAAGRDEGKAV